MGSVGGNAIPIMGTLTPGPGTIQKVILFHQKKKKREKRQIALTKRSMVQNTKGEEEIPLQETKGNGAREIKMQE